MNRENFIIATAVILFSAFLLGWFAHWLLSRLTRPSHATVGHLDRLAQQLHDAEEARDAALAEAETAAARATEAEAALSSANDDLAEGRTEIEELRAYIDKHIRPKT